MNTQEPNPKGLSKLTKAQLIEQIKNANRLAEVDGREYSSMCNQNRRLKSKIEEIEQENKSLQECISRAHAVTTAVENVTAPVPQLIHNMDGTSQREPEGEEAVLIRRFAAVIRNALTIGQVPF